MATGQQKQRKRRTIERLENQLSSGVKPKRDFSENGKTYKTSLTEKIPLTESDRKRIEQQIQTLKSRI